MTRHSELMHHVRICFVTIGIVFALAHITLGLLRETSSQVCLLFAGIVIFGLPHGAYDWLLIKDRSNTRQQERRLLLAYLLLTVLSITLVFLNPPVFLPILILLGITHFGFEELEANGWHTPSLGMSLLLGLPVLLVPFVHDPESYQGVFDILGLHVPLLAYSEHSALFRTALLLLTGLIITFVYFRQREVLSSTFIIDQLLIVTALLVFPVYISFLLYFCFWHSLRHTLQIFLSEPFEKFRDLWNRRMQILFLSTALSVLVFLAVFFLRYSQGASFDHSVVYTAFTVLLSLAVPHMLLELVPRPISFFTR